MDIDDSTVAQFVEATGASAEQASFFLEASAGNFNTAISMYRDQLSMSTARPARVTNVPPRPPAPARPYRQHPPPFPVQVINTVVALPFVVLQTGFRILFKTVHLTSTIVGTVAGRVLPPGVTRSLQGAVRALAQGAHEEDPITAAETFNRDFENRYGVRKPRWQTCSWQEAASRAHGEGKFLFVYLHSSQHQNTERYCEDTLCDPDVVDYINATFLCWAGDLRNGDTYRLSAMLNAGRYPYVALLAFSGTRIRLITAIEGQVDPQRLLTILQAAVTEHGALLWQEQLAREERENARRLRDEQDAEFQRSLEADRERERLREQQRREQEETKRLQEEQERAAAEAAAAEERKKAETEEVLKRRKSEKKLTLPEEPSADAEGVALIRVRMPSGASHQRRFHGCDALQTVYDWVDTLDSHAHLKFALASTYPRKVYGGEEMMKQTLQELGLSGQIVLLVQPEDDDE